MELLTGLLEVVKEAEYCISSPYLTFVTAENWGINVIVINGEGELWSIR